MTRLADTARLAPGAREAVFAQLVDAGRAEQVAQRLTDAITLGVLSAGERLPSEATLAKRFGVASITIREGLGMVREAGLVETRRGRDGGSFVIAPDASHGELVHSRLRKLARVEISDLAVYFSTIAAGCAERAAERTSPLDSERLDAWLRDADFGTAASARRNAGGFYLELAVLSQSTRLVREQIRLQAEFGPVLWLSMNSPVMREETAWTAREIAAAVSDHDGAQSRQLVLAQIQTIAEWLLEAKGRIDRGGELDV
ncbi:MAG: GntR family transcriptional regulator [Lacisediminihabitans sp.]